MPFDIGPGELILILIIALIVFGPGRLPDLGRQIGGAVREFRRISSAATEEMNRALEVEPPATSNGRQGFMAPAVQENVTIAPTIGAAAEAVQYQSVAETATAAAIESMPADGAVKTDDHSHAAELESEKPQAVEHQSPPDVASPAPTPAVLADSSVTQDDQSPAAEPAVSAPAEDEAALRKAAPGLVFCPKCKAGTPEINNFCGVCGSALKPPTPDPVAVPDPVTTRDPVAEEQPESPEQH